MLLFTLATNFNLTYKIKLYQIKIQQVSSERIHTEIIPIFQQYVHLFGILTNGVIRYDKYPGNEHYPENTVANFSCLYGYSLSGPSSRTCQGSGNWNGNTTTCLGNEMSRLCRCVL